MMKKNIIDIFKYKETRDVNKSLYDYNNRKNTEQIDIFDQLFNMYDIDFTMLESLVDPLIKMNKDLDNIDNQCEKYKKHITSFEDISNTVELKRPDVSLPKDVVDIYLQDYIDRTESVFDIDNFIYDESQEIILGRLIGFKENTLKVILNEEGKKIYDKDDYVVEYSYVHMEQDKRLYVVNIYKIILRENASM